ncbi:MAG: DUF6089 family protein [Raineya sp.]|nr:DUF6089 family protein [Raineya sp.]
MRKIISLIFIILQTFAAFAQKFEIGAFAGGMFYRGEVSKFSWRSPGGVVGVMFRQNWNGAISTQLSVSNGNIQASDRDNPNDVIAQQRDFSFKTRIFEIAFTGQYNFLNFGHFSESSPWTPYIFVGVAAFNMSVQNIPDGSILPYNPLQVAIPFGVGAKFMVNENWNITTEFGARKTFTDYLDDIYVRYGRNPALFSGNPNNKDTYFVFSLGISYVFQGSNCPTIYKVKRGRLNRFLL